MMGKLSLNDLIEAKKERIESHLTYINDYYCGNIYETVGKENDHILKDANILYMRAGLLKASILKLKSLLEASENSYCEGEIEPFTEFLATLDETKKSLVSIRRRIGILQKSLNQLENSDIDLDNENSPFSILYRKTSIEIEALKIMEELHSTNI